MKFANAFLLCALACCACSASAEQESKYNEIIKLLSDSDAQLKPAAQTYSASVADPERDYSSQGYSRSSERPRYAPSSSSSASKNKDDEDDPKKLEDEEDKKPDRLAILLADSKFACDGLKNGYYADESVGCQVFHYCVEGVKHSWQCPENTVFHQIHLNCVPNTQDICGESSKFHVVNDYLHKELNERGPNNTVLYHQRYYPEGFDVSGGDTVTQIFQAQAQAALLKAQNKGNPNSEDYEDEPPPRPRPSRPKSYAPAQPARAQPSRPVYKQPASRPAIPATFAPPPAPTKRPVTFTTPETYSPPAYTESSRDDDDYSSNDYSPSSGSSSSSSSSGSSSNFPSASLSSSYNSAGSSSYSPPSQSSFSSSPSHSSHSPSSSFRPSSSSRPNYPSRSLGIPIASFRVAPSQGYASQASTIQEMNVAPVVNIAAASYNQPVRGYFF